MINCVGCGKPSFKGHYRIIVNEGKAGEVAKSFQPMIENARQPFVSIYGPYAAEKIVQAWPSERAVVVETPYAQYSWLDRRVLEKGLEAAETGKHVDDGQTASFLNKFDVSRRPAEFSVQTDGDECMG